MPEGRKTLATRLRALREARGLSQKSLASASGVSFRSIQNAEQGLSDLGAESLLQLAIALDVRVDDLVRSEPFRPITPQEALEVIAAALAVKNPLPAAQEASSLPPRIAALIPKLAALDDRQMGDIERAVEIKLEANRERLLEADAAHLEQKKGKKA